MIECFIRREKAMLRNEIQEKTGLTRKAIEYYEAKGLIRPSKAENGYRDYSDEDLKALNKISLLRKLGLTIAEIQAYLCSGPKALSPVLARKQRRIEIEDRKKSILELMLRGEDENLIAEKLAAIEKEEAIYEKLERAFPGYFGQMLFIAYQPFLDEALREGEEEAYLSYVSFLDELPQFKLSSEEKEYIESIGIDTKAAKEANKNKMAAVENPEKWWAENEELVRQYEELKLSREYRESPMEAIKNKFYEFMKENKYYEIAVPLIRRFSKSYDEYYTKMLEASEKLSKTLDKTGDGK